MKVLTVIPIKRAIGRETLSYFTAEEVSLGSIVKIPIRSKLAYGIVTEITDAKEIKADIKSLSFNLKKIENIESHSFLLDKFIEAARKISDYNAGTLGSVLSQLIPKVILEESEKMETKLKVKPKEIFNETLLLQSDDEERYSTYRSLIREEFAKNHSVYFCLPTTEDILNAKINLEKGIDKFTYILHSGLPKKQILETWKKIIESDHPLLIITTGSFISIPRHDIGTIILEKESSRNYKMQTRPYLDIRMAVETIAKTQNVRLVLGDTLLRVETLWEEKNGKYSQLLPLKFRSLSSANSEIISMKIPEDMNKKEFSIFSEELKNLILKTKENNEHTFLFCGRKGLYPTTVCSDCGRVVVCNNCESPIVLYSKKNSIGQSKNLFVCHHCGERRDAGELCKYCNSWRLTTLGIGVDRVVEEIKKISEDIHVIIMDKDHLKTHKQATKARDQFYNTPGCIMVGTELALTYLNQTIENSAVVSIDSYFSIPDFQINEKIFHILLSLKSITESRFIIQTRKENVKIFDYATKGNLADFFRDEIDDRKATDYPPFRSYIKITIEGEKSTAKKQMQDVSEFLKPYKLDMYDAFNPGSLKQFTVHGLISLAKKDWVDTELLKKLRSLPQNISIKVDPVTLL